MGTFKRDFLMLMKEDEGYGDGGTPSGYVRLEERDGKGSLLAVVEHIKEPLSGEPYSLYMLAAGPVPFRAVQLGTFVLKNGRGELSMCYEPSNVSGSGIAIHDFDMAAVICSPVPGPVRKPICPLAAYRGSKQAWRDRFNEYASVKEKGGPQKGSEEKYVAWTPPFPEKVLDPGNGRAGIVAGTEPLRGMQVEIPVHEQTNEVPAWERRPEEKPEQEAQRLFAEEQKERDELEQQEQGKQKEQEKYAEREELPAESMEDAAGAEGAVGALGTAGVTGTAGAADADIICGHDEASFSELGLPDLTDPLKYDRMPFPVQCPLLNGQDADTGASANMPGMDRQGMSIPDADTGDICGACTEKCARAGKAADHGDIAKLREELDRNFEKYEPFGRKKGNYRWWKVQSPVYLNNVLYQCGIRTPVLFNPTVMMAHFKYRHLVFGIYDDRLRQKKYAVFGIPGVYSVDERPFGDMCRWVQVEGYRPRYGAFGYWLVYVDPKSGKLLKSS